MYEAEANVSILDQQLKLTRAWLVAAHDRVTELEGLVGRIEAESEDRATPRRLHEAEARVSVLDQQLRLTRTWLVTAHDRVRGLEGLIERLEADGQERLSLLRAEQERVATLADAVKRIEAESQERLSLLRAERERAALLADTLERTEAKRALAATQHRQQVQALVERLAQTELDSQQRLALLRAMRARVDGETQQSVDELESAAATSEAAELEAAVEDADPVIVMPKVSDIVTVIRPADTRRGIDFRELWQYRYLFAALIRRNIRVEFDSTRLGSFWSIARPLLLTFVFVMFRNFSNAQTREGLPYAVWVYTGLLFWTYFTDATTNAAIAVRNDAPLLTKVYYPRLLTPMVPILAGLVTLVVGLVPILAMMVWFGMAPNWQIVLLPLVILQSIALALGLGTIVSSISIENRDWERLFIFGLTVTLWISPVVYAPEMIPPELRPFYYLNPMVGLMMAFRATMFGDLPLPTWEWAYSGGVSMVLLIVGIWAFRRTEIRLLDRL